MRGKISLFFIETFILESIPNNVMLTRYKTVTSFVIKICINLACHIDREFLQKQNSEFTITNDALIGCTDPDFQIHIKEGCSQFDCVMSSIYFLFI